MKEDLFMVMVQIGRSNVFTRKLGLSTNKLSKYSLNTYVNLKKNNEIIKTALDKGITYFDTSFNKKAGQSEKLISKIIKNYGRDKIIIAYKLRFESNSFSKQFENFETQNNITKFLKKAINQALKRLNTNYIDIIYLKGLNKKASIDEAIQALVQEKTTGKIKTIGVSNFSLEQVKKANKDNQINIIEEHYSLVFRDKGKIFFQYLKTHSISFSPSFPLAFGLLTGKYDRSNWKSFSSHKFATDKKKFNKIISSLYQLKPIARSHQASLREIVLAWYINNPNISIVIPETKNISQVKENSYSLNINLSNDEFSYIDQLFPY